MDGVTVLSESQELTSSSAGLGLLVVFISLLISFFVTFGIFTLIIKLTDSDSYAIPICASLALVIIARSLSIVGCKFLHHKGKIVYENVYKVTISEEVSLKDFYEKYKVIDQEGQIYTIKEKD